jgi:hypothetical protein
MYLSSIAVASALSHASAQPLGLKGMFGIKAGFYTPSSGALRDALGDRWFSFGVGRVRTEAKLGWRTGPDIEIIRHKRGANKAAFVSPSFVISRDFGVEGAKSFPYISAGVGLSYFDYTLTRGGATDSVKRIGPSAHLQAGYVFEGRFFVSLRYNVMPSYDGYGFSGLNLSVGYGFIRF